ncbi:MAG TPA: hypothetical protein VGR20_01670 [Acidimicrobiia bacterium]|nr:hypothetical protein [Acidimicrobiia bacterium]
MIAALAPIHHPPSGMVMNDFWQPFMTFVQVIPVVVVAWLALRKWLPGERPLVMACLIGGGLASLIEPMVDHLALVWFAPEGLWKMFTTFGRSMPWFILPCYVWYIGGQAMLTLYLLRRGLTAKRLWILYGAYVVTNVVMEIPALAAGIYAYYGPQPFEVAGLPLWFQSINAASPIVAAAVIYRLGTKRGWSPWLAALVVPSCHALSNAVAGWPMWSALNSTGSLAVTYPTALITISLAVLLVYLVALAVVDEPAGAAVPAGAGGAGRPAGAEPGGPRQPAASGAR